MNGPMAYLRPAAKKPEQDPYDKLRNWLPQAEFPAKDDAPHMRLCRNVPVDFLRPFQKEKMKTSLIQFANGASLREPYSTLTAILLYEDNTNVSLINHNANILLVSGNSIEWSGLIEILNLCVCVVT
ncbi:unnamed protein product [Penicillium camemberti]|uniref:Str. FM013 n=1 Tax=Penicillium camemberti (strain FM 013) TaxID=1429867 RepID=A0A0G4PY35_PENC3|nr:unnamed protein product [Penicillium camemberti]